MDTLGSLVDKLSIVNLKLWFVQDWVQCVQAEDGDSFGAVGHATIQAKLKDLVSLNTQRSKLMTEIDQAFERAAQTGVVDVEERVKVL